MDELEKLYNVLSRDGYYTKSFDDFKSQYQDEKYRDKVYDVVSRDGLYTKSKEDFLNKYTVDVLDVDVKEKPTTVTRPISVMNEKTREIDPSKVESSLFDDNFKLLIGEDRINKVVEREDKKIDRIVNDLIGDDVEENVKIKYKTDIKNLPIETINTLADLSAPEETTTYDLSEVITYPQINFPTQSAAAAAISPSFQGGDMYGQMQDYQNKLDNIQNKLQTEKVKEVEGKLAKDKEDLKVKELSVASKVKNRLIAIEEDLNNLLSKGLGGEEQINNLKKERDVLQQISTVQEAKIDPLKNFMVEMITNLPNEDDPYAQDYLDIYQDKAVDIAEDLLNVDKAILPEGLEAAEGSIADWFLMDKENTLLEWDANTNSFKNIKYNKIKTIAENMGIEFNDALQHIEQMELLMAKKMESEDRKQLKQDYENFWIDNVNKAQGYAGEYQYSSDRKLSQHNKDFYIDKNNVKLKEAFEVENVPSIIDALDEEGFFNGHMFYYNEEEDIRPLLENVFNQLGVNVYAGVSDRFSIKRAGNNITIQAANAPELILNTYQENWNDARKQAQLLKNYIREHGDFQPILSLKDLRKKQVRTLSDFRDQMLDQEWLKYQVDKETIGVNAREELVKKSNEEFETLKKELTDESLEIEKQFNDWIVNEAPVVDGKLDPKVAEEKWLELSKPLIKKEEQIQNYLTTVDDKIKIVDYQLGINANSYNEAAEAYTKMESRKGTFESATINGLLTGTEHLTLGLSKVIGNIGIIANPFTYARAWSTGGDVSDELNKQMKAYNEGLEDLRGGISGMGTRPLQEYIQASKEDLFYGAWLGFVESAPAMAFSVATGGVGAGAGIGMFGFAAQQVSYMSEELANNPYFDNVSEWEKWALIAPVAAVAGVLEQVGLSQWALSGGGSRVLTNLTYNALKKMPVNGGTDLLKKIVKEDFKNALVRGTIRITKAGIIEYETGAAQAFAEIGAKEMYEELKQEDGEYKQIFKTSWDEGLNAFVSDLNRQGISEMLGSFYGNTPGVVLQTSAEYAFGDRSTDLQFKYVEMTTRDARGMNLLKSGLKQELLDGKITQERYNELTHALDASASVFREIPKNADIQDRKRAYDLITEKRDLQNKKEAAKNAGSDIFTETQANRLKEIDAELNEISTFASEFGQKQRVNTPLLNKAKNTELLSNEDVDVISTIQDLYATDKVVGKASQLGVDIRSLIDMKEAVESLNTISTKLKESGNNSKEAIAKEIDRLSNFIANKASSTSNSISIDIGGKIKNGKTQKQIEELYEAYRQVNGEDYITETAYFINNKAVSTREFDQRMNDAEFLEELKTGKSNILILGPSINTENKYIGEDSKIRDLIETKEIKVAEDLEKAEGLAEEIAPTVPLQSLETSKDFVKAVTEAGYNLSEDDAKNIDALITDEGEIFINKEVAKRTGAVSAPLHEVLHKIIDSEIKDPARKVEIIQEFKDELIKNPAAYDAVEKRLLEAYGETMTPEQLENSDEWVTAFFDGVARGQIKYNENVFTKIGDWVVNNILRPLGFSKIKFNSGRDVFNFAKSFGKEFKTGKVKKATKEFAKKTTAKPTQKTETKVQPELELAFSKTASDKVQQIYEEQGPAGAVEIIEQFKPITNKLVQRRSEAPNFDRELLTSEIELGERGLLDLINSYNPESGVPLAAYINKYLPSRAIEASKRVLGEQFTGDVTEARGIVQPAAEEIITEQAEVTEAKPKVKTTRQKLGIKTGSELYNKVKGAVAKTFGTKLPDPDSPNFRKELNKAYRTELKKPIADLLGTRNAYREFLETNWETLYNAIPQSILNKRFKQFIQPVVDETGKQRREKTAVGKGIFQRRDITKQEFVNYFLSPDVGASTRGTRKDALAEAIGEELALDATMEVIQDPKVLEKYEQIRELEGKPTTKQTIPKISEKVERPRGFKFSIQKNIREGVRKEGAEPITVGKKSVDRLVEIFLNDALDTFSNFLFQDITKKGKFQFISSSVLSNAGNTLERARKAGFPFIGSYEKGLADTKKRLMKDNPNMSEKKAEAQALQIMKPTRDALNAGELFETENLKKLVKESLKDKTKKFTSEELKLLNLAIDGQTRVKLEKNIKNIEDINKGKDLLLDLLRELYQKNPKNLDFISFISYHHKSNTNPFRNFATVIGEESGNLNRPYEEHTLPFGEFATTMLKAITKSDKTFKGFKDWIKDNYFQEVIEYGTTRAILDQPTRSLAKDNETKLPSWKSKSELHPLLKQHIQEALDGKREWKDVVSPDIRKYNEYSSILGYINPNKVSRLGITDAQRYNVEVAKDLQNNPDMIAAQNRLIYQQLIGEITNTKEISQALKAEEALAKGKYKASRSNIKSLDGSGVVKMSKSLPNSEILREAGIMDKALNIARDPNAPVKKIRVFDFDDTLARTKSNVLYTMPDGKEGKLTAEEFAKRGTEMLEQGAEFDFSEFNKVMKGRKGPLFEVAKKIQDARGTEDVFVLTARAAEAAPAIKEFLDSVGLNIPLKNITGLGDSSPLAKSGWIVGKAAEGYNDFYFADDAIKNVNAVKKVLDVIDVKSKVQQAKIKFSKNVDKDFNKIIEQKTGVDWYKEYSSARAQTMGAGKGKFKFLIPPSAEDFTGLLYRFLGKGKVGDAQMAWFKEHLLNPYARGMNDLSTDRVTMMNDFNALKKELAKSGSIPKNLKKKAIDNFTYEDVARVMAWDQQGIEVADLSKRDMEEFRSFIEKDPGLQVFVDQLIAINKGDGYTYPGKNWLAGNITTDLVEGLNTNKRDKYLEQWRENVDIIFSEKNLNKIEALFGSRYREALEDSLRRMKSGKNRTSTGNRLENRLLDYVNNSVGTVMFLNMRSGVLQTISSINFLNWKDNNPLRAGIAFANQKQYWKDFMTLMNSDFLVDRRKGLKINVAESEIFEAARNEKNKARAVVNYLLKKGFTVTQIMDSFAIASGGATFYRNRIKSLMKGGMTREEAETQAFQDFRETAEESQQSARPDKISQQQASGLGRVVLAFANTPMQYNRIIKKATLDLINGRGDYKTNLSKIVYYGMIQNIIFTALQQAIFAMAFSDEEDEEEKKKYYKVGNSMLDNLLRGLGVGGQAVLTVKNIGMDVYDKYQKSIAPDASFFDKQPDYAESAWHLLDFSPPISIKARKLRQAATTWEYNNWKHYKDPWSLDDPAWLASGYVISAFTNIPLDRLVKKIDNVRGAMESDQEWWKRVAMLSGWAEWELESTADKETRKQEEKIERRIFEGKQDPSNWTEAEQKDILRQYNVSENALKRLNTKEKRAELIKKLQKKTNKTYTPSAVMLTPEYIELSKLNKDEQVKILKDLNVSPAVISRMKNEDKRIKSIITIRKKRNESK